jgi:hypothetical protein
MEVRIARLESDVAHLRTDVADFKTDVRALRKRMDTRMDHLEAKLEAKLDSKFAWLLSLQLATTAGLLGAMARGFGWI